VQNSIAELFNNSN